MRNKVDAVMFAGKAKKRHHRKIEARAAHDRMAAMHKDCAFCERVQGPNVKVPADRKAAVEPPTLFEEEIPEPATEEQDH